ncbi:SUMF1/EgtB/PvdO family nonheme iron enzyme [Pseudoalteromonas sp.]|uniref:SUMF1/EgtB/PvdO family nonheme iron enzyme n=1 Tax=Pseudoalteromonas sp. TaxID=53249 RepID=UPI003567EA5E
MTKTIKTVNHLNPIIGRGFSPAMFLISALFCHSSLANNDAYSLSSSVDIQQKVATLVEQNIAFTLSIYFDTDSAKITPDYQQLLQQLISNLHQIEQYQFQLDLIGHTDSSASKDYNLELGKRRALAVKAFLQPHLQNEIRIREIQSQGMSNPAADNATVEGKALNRRVEITVEPSTLAFFEKHSKITLSGNGEALLLNNGNELVIWDTQAACPQNILTTENEHIFASAISDNKLLALSGGTSQRLTLWDVATASELESFTGHLSAITASSFSKTAEVAISGSFDGEVRLWDLVKRKEITAYHNHTAAISSVTLSSDNKYAASSDVDGNVSLWNLVTHKMDAYLALHKDAVTHLSFDEKNDFLISASKQSGIHYWQTSTGKRALFNDPKNRKINHFDISGDGQKLIAIYQNGDITLWELRTKRMLLNIENSQQQLKSVAFVNNDAVVMATDQHNNVHFWDAKNGNYLNTFTTNDWQPTNPFPNKSDNVTSWFDDVTKTQFSWVEGACYEMGCGPWNKQCSSSELPVHKVCLNGYWIAQNEVSQQLWQDALGYNPSKQPCQGETCATSAVNQVSWQDAQLFMCKLNRNAGQIYRLPTEAEWEYACRNQGENIKYFPSQQKDDNQTDLGLNNMNDGVWEWTLDAFAKDGYSKHRRHQPVYAGDDSYHFMNGHVYRAQRGGAWNKGSQLGQCSRRHYDEPGSRAFYSGLRLVKPQ